MLHFGQEERIRRPRVIAMAERRRQLIETETSAIETLDIGAGQAHGLLLISHGLGSLQSMEDIAEGLSARYPGRRIVAFSRPGRGTSPLTTSWTKNGLSHEALDLLPAFMRALGLTSVDLVAHSDGVAVAMLFACAYPWLVDRIVAISPQVHADRQFVSVTEEMIENDRCMGEMGRLCAEHKDHAMARSCWVADRRALAANRGLVIDRLTSLAAPLLLIQGLKDEYGAHEQMEALSDRIQGPMKWVMLRKDGHYPHHDNAEVVMDLISGHLDEPMPAKKTGFTPSRKAV